MKAFECPRIHSRMFAKPRPARTRLVAALAGLAMALGPVVPAAVVHAHDASWGAGGVLHDYTLKFCAKRKTGDHTHSSRDDYYKVKFEYRWKDVGYEVHSGISYGYTGVSWYKWGSDGEIHVAPQYTNEWRCHSVHTKAVLAGHGKSNGYGDYINGRVTTSHGNTVEIDIDYWVNTNNANSVCAKGYYTRGNCLGSLCWGGYWTTTLRANCW